MVVLNDDSTTHRNGTMTMIDQTVRSTCEVASTALSPPVRPLRFSVTALSSVATARHRRRLLSPPPVRRLIANTITANSSVTTASTTPIAVA